MNHLGSYALARELASAALVVCRSGYSTVMDLVRLRCRAVLVPTPGQTEQEYLARHLTRQGWFLSFDQSGIDLAEAITKGLSHEAPACDFDFESHLEAVQGFLAG